MAKVHSRQIPYLAPRPYEDGSGWYVEAKWIGRATEQLGRFDTYYEAGTWITLESTTHFVLREIESMVTSWAIVKLITRIERALAVATPDRLKS
jgi:hypothetical protein